MASAAMGEVSYVRSAGAARSYNGAQRAPLPYMYCTLLFEPQSYEFARVLEHTARRASTQQ